MESCGASFAGSDPAAPLSGTSTCSGEESYLASGGRGTPVSSRRMADGGTDVLVGDGGENLVSASLVAVLNSIYSAGVCPWQEKQRLATHAIARVLDDGKSQNANASATHAQMHFMQQALHVIASAAGMKTMSIIEARSWLRANGHGDIASRMSRASKARNSRAHPDVALLDVLR
jgi:hypothetical protein